MLYHNDLKEAGGNGRSLEERLLLQKLLIIIGDYMACIKKFGSDFYLLPSPSRSSKEFSNHTLRNGLAARRYIFDNDSNDGYSFLSLCHLLGIRASCIRERLKTMLPKEVVRINRPPIAGGKLKYINKSNAYY